MRSIAVALLCLCACEKSEPEPAPKPAPSRFDGPMPIVYGDCADATVAFVSGPRPGPVTRIASASPAPAPAPAAGSGAGSGSARRPMSDLTRAQVLEEARTAGILGSTALAQGSGSGTETGVVNGGFGYGRDGFGSSGGTGWGTIGIGSYGTIGHGRGSGASGTPIVSLGEPDANSDLDRAIIRRYIKRNMQTVKSCYQKQLLANPKLAGTVRVKFFIKPDGTVVNSQGSGVDATVASCVAEVIGGIEFPHPRGGGGVQVTYPFVFQADGIGDSAGSASASDATGSGSAAATTTTATAAVTQPPSAALGLDNPLRAQEAAVAGCLRDNPAHAGAIVVELAYGAAGDVTTASVHGLDDGPARACVIASAQQLKRVAQPAGTQRCPIAFGVMAPADMPGIDIANGALAFAGQPIASASPNDPMIPSLLSAVEARRKTADASAAVIAIRGPLVLRPADATPMTLVNRVLLSVRAAGDDLVLAANRNGAWTTLPPMWLPVVPVPVGAGGRWSRFKPDRLAAAGAATDSVTLSVLVTKDKIWLGVSRVNEFVSVDRDASLAKHLAAALSEQKASAFFADRADLEIAGADDVTYADVVAAIDAAIVAGFTDWEITDPNALTVRPTL